MRKLPSISSGPNCKRSLSRLGYIAIKAKSSTRAVRKRSGRKRTICEIQKKMCTRLRKPSAS